MRRIMLPAVMGLLVLGWAACEGGKKYTPDDGDELDQQGDDAADGVDGDDQPDTIPDVPGEDVDTDTPVDVIPDTVDDEPCVSTCGNHVVECDEECDDGNTDAGDGCSPTCTAEATSNCGDGNVDYADGEECDDGNNDDGDGCSASCRIEAPGNCGDGNLDIDQGEECDDGNRTGGDGCSSTCQIEPVGADCGNGTVEGLEVCDDSNLTNGDGCNPTCNSTNTTSVFVGSQGQQGLVDGSGTTARIGGYGTLCADATYLYYGDASNHVVRRIEVATATVQTIAGDAAGGTAGYVDDPVGTNARFGGNEAVTTDGHTLWVADGANRRLRAVDLTAPFAVTTVAGSGSQAHTDGIGTAAEFDDMRGLTYYAGYVYLLDANGATLRRFNPATQEVQTIAGSPYATGTTDGFGSAARFMSPRYMTSDNSGMLYIADTNGSTIRSYNTVTTWVGTFAGSGACGYVDGTGTAALIHRPRGMTSDGASIYWVEFNAHTVRQGVLATAGVSTMLGTYPACTVDCSCGTPPAGSYAEGTGTAALFNNPFSIVYHYPSNSLFIVDAGNYVIRRVQ